MGLKFPQKVLQRFVESFSIVQLLGHERNETQVFEEYLIARWSRHDPSLGPAPSGEGAVAMMRLILMAQGDSQEIISQFKALPDDDRKVLSQEMAISGCKSQYYEQDVVKDSSINNHGPALLIYYSPALLQKSGKKDPT